MISAQIDVSRFNQKFNEYMNYTSRDLYEAINQHGYYIARNAVIDTKAATPEEIERELLKKSRDYPNAPVAGVIINAQLGNQGLKGLTGEKMARAIEKKIRKDKASRNFLRAGWLAAVKDFERVVKSKRGSKPLPRGMKIKGRKKGGGSPAKMFNASNAFKAIASLWNSVYGGKKANAHVKELIRQGAAMAVNEEIDSMQQYIVKKQTQNAQKVGWSK